MSEATAFRQRVIHCMAEQVGVSDQMVETSDNLRTEFVIDSLDEIEFVMALEDEFAVEIVDDDAEQWKTLDDVVAYLEKLTADRAEYKSLRRDERAQS